MTTTAAPTDSGIGMTLFVTQLATQRSEQAARQRR
jgi:hypothetical protein